MKHTKNNTNFYLDQIAKLKGEKIQQIPAEIYEEGDAYVNTSGEEDDEYLHLKTYRNVEDQEEE